MKGFGASAPGSDLFDHFGINKENVLKVIKEKL
jgi:transketolase